MAALRTPPELSTGTHAFFNHLLENEAELLDHNILLVVDTINETVGTAHCTVRQHRTGLFRRTLSHPELVWRAEQALSPLLVLGFSPMINALTPLPAAPPPRSAWYARVMQYLGLRGTRGLRTVRSSLADPFGWRNAVSHAIDRTLTHTP